MVKNVFMIDEIENLKAGYLIDSVDESSGRKTIEKWVREFESTHYPNRMITRQTVKVFQRAVQLNIPISRKHLNILPSDFKRGFK